VLEGIFKFKLCGTTLARDTLAGLTTFMVMSYIIFVNPNVLSLGEQSDLTPALITSTCLVAGVMSILMGVVSNRAFAIAPGMGLNAVVAYQLIAGQGLTMKSAMGVIVMEGIVITVLVLVGLRKAVFEAVPLELKKAISVGIGFFILFIGLVDGGIVVPVPGGVPPVGLGDLIGWPVAVTVFGLLVTIVMMARKWKGAVLFGIVLSTVLATILNYAYDKKPFGEFTAVWPGKAVETPDFGLVGQFDFGFFSKLGVMAACLWVFSIMLSDFFDTMGTLVGVGSQAGYLDDEGNLPGVQKPLVVDSVAAMAGGACSASSATTYIESGAGVSIGGRTGWVAIITGACFLLSMPFWPIAGIVPANATAPALIIVGYYMMATLTEKRRLAGSEVEDDEACYSAIDFSNLAFGLPAILTMTIMPLTYSITNGIGAGFIAYVIVRVSRGEGRKVPWLLWVFAAAFLVYFLFPLMRAQFGWNVSA
jgi:AGZA family xanthine/uracil permease-like MFS transporter